MSQGLESPKAEVLLERLREYVSEQGTHFAYHVHDAVHMPM